MLNDLLLLSGNDIPFIKAQLTIHQPTIKQISYISEDVFYSGCEYLNFSKKNLNTEDKNRLKNLNDFEILMAIINNNSNNDIMKKKIIHMQLVLLLLFPEYKINFLPNSILLSKKVNEKNENHLIDKDNYNDFKNILQEIFCLQILFKSDSKYNPGGPQAKALVQKFKKRQQKLAKLKNKKKQSISILSQYISILAVGQKKNINELLQYTVYQLFNEFHRFKMKDEYDLYVKAKMAGAENLQEVENWMSNMHSNNYKEDNFI